MPGKVSPTATCEIQGFSSDPVVRGNNVGIFGRVTNTSNNKQRFNLRLTATLSSTVYVITESVVRFNANQALLISKSWFIPADATAGDYVVLLEVEAGSTVIASDTDTLTVSAS